MCRRRVFSKPAKPTVCDVIFNENEIVSWPLFTPKTCLRISYWLNHLSSKTPGKHSIHELWKARTQQVHTHSLNYPYNVDFFLIFWRCHANWFAAIRFPMMRSRLLNVVHLITTAVFDTYQMMDVLSILCNADHPFSSRSFLITAFWSFPNVGIFPVRATPYDHFEEH